MFQTEEDVGKMKCWERECEDMKAKLLREEAKSKELSNKLAAAKTQGASTATSAAPSKAKKVYITRIKWNCH